MTEPLWRAAVGQVLSDPSLMRVHVQPILDVANGTVAGYEALARFPPTPHASPDIWFQEAARLGHGLALEAKAFRAALDLREGLPEDSFLSVNASPELLLSEEGDPSRFEDLSRVVLEVTEHAPIADYGALLRRLDALRARGAFLAVDDAGAGYASLRHVLTLRPDFVKLDRAMVMDLDQDAAKRAVVEALGELASRIDAWVVAEGVERAEEMTELQRLEVPLAQGYWLSRPAVPWPTVAEERLAAIARQEASMRRPASVRSITEARPPLPSDASLEDARLVLERLHDCSDLVMKDARGRVQLLLRRHDLAHGTMAPVPALIVDTRTPIRDVVRRAMTRPVGSRYDSLVVQDGTGRYIGVVAIDRLVHRLLAEDDQARARLFVEKDEGPATK